MRASGQGAAICGLTLALAGCNPNTGENAVNAMAEANDASPANVAVRAEDLQYCPVVQKRITRDDCEDLTRTSDVARAGAAAVNVPSPMWRGRSETIQLAVGVKPPDFAQDETGHAPDPRAAADNATEVVLDNMTANSGQPDHPPRPSGPDGSPADVVRGNRGVIVQYAPIVGRYMRASLVGRGFDIKPLSAESQVVGPDSYTTWEWQVTPVSADAYVLTLKTVVEGETATGQRYPLKPTSRNLQFKVEVSTVDRIKDALLALPDWLKAITAVLTALALLLTAWWGVRRALAGKA